MLLFLLLDGSGCFVLDGVFWVLDTVNVGWVCPVMGVVGFLVLN